jgi:lipopolysaccharide/colanic/teichoic acid biosynthesis glycosyltransferase
MIAKIVALPISFLLAPLFLIISILNLIFLGLPIFFTQERVGKDNKTFNLIKFRTMYVKESKEVDTTKDNQRLNGYGKFLRSTSLDELPSLVNIIKGEMTFIGPRPLLIEYLEFYSPEQLKRHNVLPGITGWAQINGRNNISWKEKFVKDVWYVNNKSFFLDIKIILVTIKKVILRLDINKNNQITIEKFNGRN